MQRRAGSFSLFLSCLFDLFGIGRVRAIITSHDCLSKTILPGILKGGRHRGRHMKCWMDLATSDTEWTSLSVSETLSTASRRKDWTRISAESSTVSPRQTNRSKDYNELNCKQTHLIPLSSIVRTAAKCVNSGQIAMGTNCD